MSGRFAAHLPFEEAYVRRMLFAVELLDAVTLARVSQGLAVDAEGLRGKAIVNVDGFFVWLDEDIAPLRKITVDPGLLPYEKVEISAEQLQRPLTTVELSPRLDYPFAAGITGLRGTLIEDRVAAPQRAVPVPNASVRLRWLDDDGDWRDAPTVSHTNAAGDFTVILRLAPSEAPPRDIRGAVTVRLHAYRSVLNERSSSDFQLLLGRVADPSTFAQDPNALIFAWDELQP